MVFDDERRGYLRLGFVAQASSVFVVVSSNVQCRCVDEVRRQTHGLSAEIRTWIERSGGVMSSSSVVGGQQRKSLIKHEETLSPQSPPSNMKPVYPDRDKTA